MFEPPRDDKPLNLDDSVCFDELGRTLGCHSRPAEAHLPAGVRDVPEPHWNRRCQSAERELLRHAFPEMP